MRPDKTLFFKNRSEWRKWLERNNDSRNEAWLIHYRKHVDKTGLRHLEAVEEAICYGWIDGKLMKLDGEKFALRYSPRKAGSVWSKINRDTAERMIKSGEMTEAGLKKIEAAKRTGSWDKAYTNRKRERMPSDLKAALMSNKTAWHNFKKFANTYWNMYIGWVTGAKTPETRKRRIEEVVKRSATNKKPGL